MLKASCARVLGAATPHAGIGASNGFAGVGLGGKTALILLGLFLMVFSYGGCSSTTGWRIPGTEKGAGATTKVHLVLENVETVPEELRAQGEIYVGDAFFGRTSRPFYNRFVGNALVVGTIQIEKEKTHTVRVEFPGYEPFEHTRYFGTLPEYSISFRLTRLEGEPSPVPAPEPEAMEAGEEKWYQFWRWFEE